MIRVLLSPTISARVIPTVQNVRHFQGLNLQALEQVSRVHYKDFMDVGQYVHGYATMYANASNATYLKCVEERQMPLYEPFNGLRHCRTTDAGWNLKSSASETPVWQRIQDFI